ncbi:MAG: hypothetical protein Q9167_006944, partial [Letrouitia subvulpina]
IRRIDTPSLLLHTSLRLASLAPNSSPLSHPHPIHPTCTIAPRTTVSADSLLGPNTSVYQHAIIKNSVIGANCVVGAGARLTRCVIMDDVDVGEKCQLVGCVVGQRARLGKECKLGEGCEVQPGFVVEEGTEGKGEKFMVFEGLENDGDEDDGGEGMDEAEEGEGESLSFRG